MSSLYSKNKWTDVAISILPVETVHILYIYILYKRNNAGKPLGGAVALCLNLKYHAALSYPPSSIHLFLILQFFLPHLLSPSFAFLWYLTQKDTHSLSIYCTFHHSVLHRVSLRVWVGSRKRGMLAELGTGGGPFIHARNSSGKQCQLAAGVGDLMAFVVAIPRVEAEREDSRMISSRWNPGLLLIFHFWRDSGRQAGKGWDGVLK